MSDELQLRVEALQVFIDEHLHGGCRWLSVGDKCLCSRCNLETLLAALRIATRAALDPPAPPESARLAAFVEAATCEHPQRTGGNDYIACGDCGLMWDYRREQPQDALKRCGADLLAALHAAPQEDFDPPLDLGISPAVQVVGADVQARSNVEHGQPQA